MIYISAKYFLLLAAVLAAYYLLPAVCGGCVLLAGSLFFYCIFMGRRAHLIFLLAAALVSFAGALLAQRTKNLTARRILTGICMAVCALPLLAVKTLPFISRFTGRGFELIVPLGLAFYTLQLIGYLADVCAGRIGAEKNLFKYLLFVMYFPQILQGPIPRYDRLADQLWTRRPFRSECFEKGLMMMLWGIFLKLMIADRAAPFVNEVFDHFENYSGAWFWLGGILYSIQLYADFLGCSVMAQGVSQMLGITLEENFRTPYAALSLQDFWRRWHRSLSGWLRDYVYIPLGGGRCGKLRKYTNLMLTFLVSGLWHGEGFRYLFWGLYHGACQIIGTMTRPLRDGLSTRLLIGDDSLLRTLMRRASTLFLVMTGWIIFRAGSLRAGLLMIRSMLTDFNPWILLNGEAAALLPEPGGWMLLGISLTVMALAGHLQQRMVIRDRLAKEHAIIRWGLIFGLVVAVWVFGAYGDGFNASEFIYGGF